MIKSLSEAEAAVQLEQLEQEFGLWQLRVDGFSPWRIVRFAVGLELQNMPFNSNDLPRVAMIWPCLRSLFDLIRPWPSFRYAVKSYSSALRVKTPAGYEDTYYEALLQLVPGGVRLHSYNATGYERRSLAWRGSNIDITLILVAGALLGRLLPLKGHDQIFGCIATATRSRLGKDRFPTAKVRRMFSSFLWQAWFYRRLLKKLGVKTLFVADTGERAFLKAARENGCKLVELQHGIYTPNHPDAIPHVTCLDADDQGLLLPDIVAVYGSHWADAHSQRLLGVSRRVRPIGASFIDQLKLQRLSDDREHVTTRLLVTTQGLARDALISLLREFLDSCKLPLRLDIKLHPAFDPVPTQYTEALGSDNRVNVILGSAEPDTYSLLAGCSLHLSISSACHYDALGLRVPTAVLALSNHEMVLDLVEAGQALLVRNGTQLAQIVESRSWIPVPLEVANHYFKPEFASNLSEWIPSG